MRRTALITGATGFVGGHLAGRLAAEGWKVRALVRPTSDTRRLEELGAELAPGGLDDPDSLAAAADGADTVFHLAAATTAASEDAFRRVNAEGTRNLARALLRGATRPRRLVYLSSYAACGPAPDGRPRRVDDPPAPLTAYGRTKLEGEAAAREVEAGGVELLVVRAPAVYGPGDRAFLPVYRLVRRKLATVPAGPERRVHLIYVEDLARALARAADAPPGTYAVAEPRAHTQAGLTDEIARALGTRPLKVPVPAAVLRAAGALAERFGHLAGGAGVFSREKAEEMLAGAWVCDLAGSEALLAPGEATPLERGTAETARWYRTQGWL
jgi:nucleoside-diphosphate-sugar epimerase